MGKDLAWGQEVRRKLFHIFWIILALFAWFGVPYLSMVTVMRVFLVLLFLFLLFDFLRVEHDWKFLRFMMRSKERGMFCGGTTGMIGVILVFTLTHFQVAVLATFFMGVGDLIAGVVRKKWGQHDFLKKTWEDFGAGTIANIVLGGLLVPNPVLLFPMAIAAQVAENAVSVLDDNLVMILVAAVVGQLVLVYV